MTKGDKTSMIITHQLEYKKKTCKYCQSFPFTKTIIKVSKSSQNLKTQRKIS